jgi:hypothetical protein
VLGVGEGVGVGDGVGVGPPEPTIRIPFPVLDCPSGFVIVTAWLPFEAAVVFKFRVTCVESV